jgi:hypothetical protein
MIVRPLITECCHADISPDERYCRKCGWEARVQPAPLKKAVVGVHSRYASTDPANTPLTFPTEPGLWFYLHQIWRPGYQPVQQEGFEPEVYMEWGPYDSKEDCEQTIAEHQCICKTYSSPGFLHH